VAIFRLGQARVIAQPSDGVCWYATLQVLGRWRKSVRGSMGEMIAVEDQPDCARMYKQNQTWPADNNSLLAQWLRMKKYSKSEIKMEYKALYDVMNSKGPIYAAGVKTWGTAAHGHVVAFAGVADTGVLVLDPEPMNTGLERWRTWDEIDGFLNRKTAADGTTVSIDYNFLTGS
jgi:hypothetical protein